MGNIQLTEETVQRLQGELVHKVRQLMPGQILIVDSIIPMMTYRDEWRFFSKLSEGEQGHLFARRIASRGAFWGKKKELGKTYQLICIIEDEADATADPYCFLTSRDIAKQLMGENDE